MRDFYGQKNQEECQVKLGVTCFCGKRELCVEHTEVLLS